MGELPSLGQDLVDWQRRNLVHGPGDRFGEPYEPEPWMIDATIEMYRYDPVSLERVVERVLVGIGKGNAKTEWAAALALGELCGPVVPSWVAGKCPKCGVSEGDCVTPSGKPASRWHRGREEWVVEGKLRKSPDVPIGAASREQANLCFGAASAMVKNGPLAPFFDVFQHEMQFKDGRPGRMYRIAAEAGTQDGSLPTCFVADEVHEWVDSKARVHTVVTNSLQKRSPSLEVNITTAGDPVKSELLLSMYEYGRKVTGGEVDDPSFYFVWFEPEGQVRLDDPVGLRAAIKEANPSSWVDVERLARRVEVADIKESVFRRYHLNQWVTSGDPFLETAVWDGLYRAVEVEDKSRVVLGFDGSYNGDSTCLIGVTLDTDLPHVFEVASWERPEVARDDWKVPRYEVDAAVDASFRSFEVVELVCDPARWMLYMDEWVTRYGDDRVIEFPNSTERMTPATAKFHDAVQAGLLTHDGSALLRRHVQNAVTKANPRGYVVRKDHPNRKIDGLVAALMAHDRATWRREEDMEVSAELW